MYLLSKIFKNQILRFLRLRITKFSFCYSLLENVLQQLITAERKKVIVHPFYRVANFQIRFSQKHPFKILPLFLKGSFVYLILPMYYVGC